MTGTYPCVWTGCNKVFRRAFELRKHRATHEDPGSIYNCPHCAFFTLDPRNLETHVAGHTGEKRHECPHGTTESPCDFRTHDRSLLSKHRVKSHGHIPRGRAPPPEPPRNTTSVPSPSLTTTKNATSERQRKEKHAEVKAAKEHAIHKAKKGKGRATQDPASSSMSQDELDSLLDGDSGSDSVVGSSSVAINRSVQSSLSLSNQVDSSMYGQGIPRDQYRNTVPIAPQHGISSSYTATYDTVVPIDARQDIQDEDAGILYWTIHTGYDTNNEHIYGYMDVAGCDFTGTSSDARPAIQDNTAHVLSECAIRQDMQEQSAHGTQSTPVASDQGISSFAFQSAQNDHCPPGGSTSTQPPRASNTASTEPSVNAEDAKDYLESWLPKAAWDDIWATFKQKFVGDANAWMFSAHADEV